MKFVHEIIVATATAVAIKPEKEDRTNEHRVSIHQDIINDKSS